MMIVVVMMVMVKMIIVMMVMTLMVTMMTIRMKTKKKAMEGDRGMSDKTREKAKNGEKSERIDAEARRS